MSMDELSKIVSDYKYSGDLNIDHLNTMKHFNTKHFEDGFQMVWYSNGRFMYYVLCTRPTI